MRLQLGKGTQQELGPMSCRGGAGMSWEPWVFWLLQGPQSRWEVEGQSGEKGESGLLC